MGKRIEYVNGDKIGDVYFIKDIETRINTCGGHYRVMLVKCRCGVEFEARMSDVKYGNTKSCGCHNIAKIKERMTLHGKSEHKLMSKWGDMIRRTTSEKSMSFKNYGARGISVCEEWKNSYITFYNWAITNGYKEGLSIDRINVDGNYEPSNCRWATREIQSRNTQKIRSNNTTGYRGVNFHKRFKKFYASIGVDKTKIGLGHFNTALEAAKAYDKYVIDNKLEHTINGVL